MTLEDFFTSTEIKDGLTASTQVKELVNVMLEERDCVLKNACKATRQWSTVASTIAATEDKECLDLFVQLDGILLINKWLEDAQELGNELSDSSAEELITCLLNAVEKLRINYEQSVAYGIQATVKKLLGHCSIRVQEKAGALSDSWKRLGAGEVITGLGGEGGQIMSSAGDGDPSFGVTHGEKPVKIGADMVPHTCSNDVLPDKVDDIEAKTGNEEKGSDHENMKDEVPIMKLPFEGSHCKEGEYPPCHLEGNPSNTISTAVVPKEDGMVSNQCSGNEVQMQDVGNPSNRSDAMEISPPPVEKDSEPVTGVDLQTGTSIKVDNDSKESAKCDMKEHISSSKDNSAINVDGTPPSHSEIMAVSQIQAGDCDMNIMDHSGNEHRLPILDSPDTSSSGGDSDSTNGEHSNSESRGLMDTDFLKTRRKDNDVVKKNRSDFELNYGMFDALEVARQVAIEVEREVEGRRETSCSSSPKNLETETRQPDSLASVRGNETQTDESALKEDSTKEGEFLNDQNDSSQVLVDGQEPESKPDKGKIDFDLNQDICSCDTDHPLDRVPTPVSTVSASRAPAAAGFPASPLQFDGAHGWKGSAATSAFRPASPRKVYDGDNLHNNSKHRQNFLDFDLNVSEDGDDKATDTLSRKQTFHSGESSGEARLILDLNQISDEGDAPPSDWRVGERLLLGRNGHQNASPSTSSSSMQQPPRNLDLNDQPSFVNDSSELNFFAKLSSSQKLQSFIGPGSDKVISIMGTKVEVNQKDFIPQQHSFQNGNILQPALDLNLTRTGGVLGIESAVPYPHPTMFTYNGLTTGPTGTFSPVMYRPSGPVPYVVDSRGAPVMPQFLGSASAVSAPYSQRPFDAAGIYGMHPQGLNGPVHGPSLPNFELNLGLMGERVNKESGGLRQFLGPCPNRSFDELRSNCLPSSSVGLGKRKELDSMWEPYPFDHKHHHPQWK